MDSEIVKGKPLSKEETKFLVNLIEGSTIIISKTTNATNNKLKNEEWIRLADRFNASVSHFPRTPQQLRLKWENLKKNARKRSTKIRMNQIKTGGGPPDYIPPDDILDRVSGLLGSTASGFTVPFGGDREPELEFFVGGGDGDGGSGDGTGDARVSVIETINDAASIPIDNGVEAVTECHVLDIVDQNMTPSKSKRFTFGTPRAVKKKQKSEDSRTMRNIAIAEYFSTKKKCLDLKKDQIALENETLKLRNEKLLLETAKLKLELEKFKGSNP